MKFLRLNVNTRFFLTSILLVVFQLPTMSYAATPAWCNANTLEPAEQIICTDPTLSKADALLEQLYRAILSFRGLEGHEGMWPSEIISNQRDWVATRNTLTDKSDILDSYSARIQSLTNVLKLRWQPI